MMADAADDWQPVAAQDDWQPVGDAAPREPESVPDAFTNRVEDGDKIREQMEAGHAYEVAAERVRQSVKPTDGRKEGGITKVLSNFLPYEWQRFTDVAEHAVGAAKTYAETGIYNPQPILEASLLGLDIRSPVPGDKRFSRLAPNGDKVQEQPIGGLPQPQDFKTAAEVITTPAPPSLVVARKMPDGTIKYGEPGDVHSDLMTKRELNADGPTPPEVGEAMGFALPGGEFMTRAEALDYAAHNEPARAAFSFEQPGHGLEAAKYFEPATGNSVAAESNLRDLWQERGIHPAEAAHDAQGDAFLRHDLGAAATDALPPTDVPLSVQPSPAPGRVMTMAHDAAAKLTDIGDNLQMMVAPMATGTTESMALAKDFANSMRRNRWEWARIDQDIEKRFTPEQRKRMWDAADEESVMRQEGKSSENMGLATLEPAERAAVDDLQTRGQIAWAKARDLGMVEGEGLPAYTPRMLINAAEATSGEHGIPLNGLGHNLKTKTAQMKGRKYLTAEETEAAAKARLGEGAEIARDIRTLPLATAKLEDAIAGRTLINSIKDAGKRTGTDTVSEGGIPVRGADLLDTAPEQKWFTLDHPAFKTWRPKFKEGEGGKIEAVKDAEGNTVFEQVPLYVRGDFEGPLRAVLTEKSGPLYQAAMSLKGKTMSLIMNSPLIHDAVEWGRALPAMPGKVATFKVYFEGNAAKKNPAIMGEAIDNGLVPIGKRFFNQDVTSIMESPDLAPGRSLTAKVLGLVPGLFDEAAGATVMRAIDKAGDFWHNTLLWDRVADLQMGLYTNFHADLMAKGVDRQTASRAAAHFANRFAGALPQEAMSNGARKVANSLLFSRTFTLGNLGVLKDMTTGLPKDVLAQIERDTGKAMDPDALGNIKSIARRKAVGVIVADMALMYVGNSILQSGVNVMANDSTLDAEMHGYAERMQQALTETKENPLKLIQPFGFLESMSATETNEPGKQDRVKIGHAADGTAVYMRNPAGKIGEEFVGYMTGPLDMLRRKLGTIARPVWQILANDKGFGRKVYDPAADTPAKYLKNAGNVALAIVESQLPTGQLNALADLVKGDGDPKVNAAQALGPLLGVTFSKGAPGGEAIGELYAARGKHQYAVDAAMPDIRKQILRGDVAGAMSRMAELGIPAGLQRYYVKTTQNPATRLSPRSLRDFYNPQYSTPEQRSRMERARGVTAPPP